MRESLRNSHLVLVVEDNRDTILEVRKILKSLGHECAVASTQLEAEALLKSKRHFCLLLLDLAFPVEDASEQSGPEQGFPGFALLRRARTVYGLSKAEHPAIVMTAYPAGFENCRKAFHEGANDYLGKPLRLTPNQDTEAVICRWLKAGCEEHHATCPGTSSSGTPAPKPIKKEREYSTNHRLHLHGGPGLRPRRYRVDVGTVRLELTDQGVQILYVLAEHDRQPGDGFLANSLFGLVNPANAIHLLKKDLKTLGHDDLIQSDKGGRHRLTCPPHNVTYNDAVMGATFHWFKKRSAPASESRTS